MAALGMVVLMRCFVLVFVLGFLGFVRLAEAQTQTFDPNHPLPGKQEPDATGPRAFVPAALSLVLASSGVYLAKQVIVAHAELGQDLPQGSLAVGVFAAALPSIGRLFVPAGHPVRNAALYSSARMFCYALFFASNVGVSRQGRGVAEVGFLMLGAIDVATTMTLRFPGATNKLPAYQPQVSLLSLGAGGHGLGVGVRF